MRARWILFAYAAMVALGMYKFNLTFIHNGILCKYARALHDVGLGST